jgi:ribokinase
MTGRVFVLGNAMLDETVRLPALPARGETVVADGVAVAPGGKGLNQAVAAARAGAAVRFRAALGADPAAARVMAALRDETGLVADWLHKALPTDRSIILVDAAGENCIVSLCGCADVLTEAEAADFAAAAGPGDLLLMQGNLGAAATRAAVAASAAPVLLNAAPVRWPVAAVLPGCAALVVNAVEAARLAGTREPAAAAMRLLAGGAAAVIVTLGAAGCLLATEGVVTAHPTRPVRAVDSAGAGDAFCGVLAAARLAGCAWPAAIAHAQAAAALTVQRPGCFAALPRRAEIGLAGGSGAGA